MPDVVLSAVADRGLLPDSEDRLSHFRVEAQKGRAPEKGHCHQLCDRLRIMLMTLPGRETPEMSAVMVFTDTELEVMQAYAQHRKLKPPANLHEAVSPGHPHQPRRRYPVPVLRAHIPTGVG